ncbi:hypothetical protein LXL04_024927 [Taraxacum kok-saghyz]
MSIPSEADQTNKVTANVTIATNSGIVNSNPLLDPKLNAPLTFVQMLESKNSAVSCKIKILPKDPNKKIGVVEMPIENLISGSAPYSSTLIGFFIDKKLAFPTVKYFVMRMWKQFGLEDLMVNDEGFYFFRFSENQGMENVMDNGPWLINNVPLFVQRWKPGLVLSKPEMTMVPVWVKIFNVPLEYWNEEGIAHITNEIGRPIMMDRVTQKMCENHWGRPGFMRILIEMSAESEWLKNVNIISRDLETGEKKSSMCRIEYAWIPSRCSNCKVYGHDDRRCAILLSNAKDGSKDGEGSKKNENVKAGNVDEVGFLTVARKNNKGKSQVVVNSDKEGNKIDLIATLEKKSIPMESKNLNKKEEVKKSENKNDHNKENLKTKQGQNGKNANSSRSNFSKFAVGNLKRGLTNEDNKHNQNQEGKILKSKQVYVPVVQQLKEASLGNYNQGNKQNSGKSNIVNSKSDKSVKKLVNRFDILKNKDLEGDMFMDETNSDDDVDEIIEMETENLKTSDTLGAEKLCTKKETISGPVLQVLLEYGTEFEADFSFRVLCCWICLMLIQFEGQEREQLIDAAWGSGIGSLLLRVCWDNSHRGQFGLFWMLQLLQEKKLVSCSFRGFFRGKKKDKMQQGLYWFDWILRWDHCTKRWLFLFYWVTIKIETDHLKDIHRDRDMKERSIQIMSDYTGEILSRHFQMETAIHGKQRLMLMFYSSTLYLGFYCIILFQTLYTWFHSRPWTWIWAWIGWDFSHFTH